MQQQSSSKQVSVLLKSAKAPSLFGLVGYGIVMVAFLLAVINALLPTPVAFIKAVLQPFIFVGVASLLYHIGQHVHVSHVNALRMMMADSSREDARQSGH